MSDDTDEKKGRVYGWRESYPRFYKADATLQQKVGVGPLDEALLVKIQEYMDTYQADVSDLIALHVASIKDQLKRLRLLRYGRDENLSDIIKPIMQIKAVAGMFGPKTVGQLAGILLHFLESTHSLNNDALEIVDAFLLASGLVLSPNGIDFKQANGFALCAELQAACDRYKAKYDAMKTAP